MKLRAHHILCVVPMQGDFNERGPEYIQTENKIKETMGKGVREMVEVVLGVDDLCHVCPLCRDDRCQSPNGDEDSVRKWDAILLRGLGVSQGTILSADEWRRLIEEKSPLEFCQGRCPHRMFCERSGANFS